jgi:rhodanese-related sulfurtransferase
MKTKITIFLMISLVVLFCTSVVNAADKTPEQIIQEAKAVINEVSISDVKKMINNKEDIILLDVRDKEEYETGHIPEAINISRGTLELKAPLIIPDKTKKIIVYCGLDLRSPLATKSLNDIGYRKAVNMIGGLKAWKEAVFGLVLSPNFNKSGSHHGLYKDILPELVKDANSPFRYDKEVEEYQIVYDSLENGKKVSHSIPLYYSPFTGEKLRSGRDKLFTKPSKQEMEKIAAKIQGAKTLEEIEQRLGKPDYVFYDAASDIKTQYTYSNLSDSADVVIQLHNDGRLSFSYGGKYIGKKK